MRLLARLVGAIAVIAAAAAHAATLRVPTSAPYAFHVAVPRGWHTLFDTRGIGSALVKAELDLARAQGWKVVPVCPFVKALNFPETARLTQSLPFARALGASAHGSTA